jgi:hypothetical protein
MIGHHTDNKQSSRENLQETAKKITNIKETQEMGNIEKRSTH